MKIASCSLFVSVLLFAVPAAGIAADAGLRQGLSPLAARQHCDECHAMKEARIGPPFFAVAARYGADGDAAVNRLALKIINGGGGNWGTIPMVANERISMDDARSIARWILALGHNG
jgi:cytochrome c